MGLIGAAGFSVELNDKEYYLFAELIYQLSGIQLGENKKELMKARLMKRMRFHAFSTFKEYYKYVINDASGAELEQLLNAISTNVSHFMREGQHFRYLADTAIPNILSTKKDNRLHIWSCACATGEEVYSIAITLLEHCKIPSHIDIKVLGSDISTKALQAAREAKYDVLKLREVPKDIFAKYFSPCSSEAARGNCYRVAPKVREKAFFARLNLMGDVFPFKFKFDVIFCRNVMIYFDRDTQHKLIEKLYRYLADDGYLFIGHSESLFGIQTKFKSVAPAVLQKLK